jgi:hypothetical protein
MSNDKLVLDEMKTWLMNSITEVQKLRQKGTTPDEFNRLHEKESTLRMALSKLCQLQNEE